MTQVTMCPETEQEAQSVSHGADLIVRLRRLLFSRLLRLLRRILFVKGSCVPLSQLMFCPQGITMLLMLVVVVVVLVAAAPELTARMRQANTADLSAMALPTPQKKRP